MYNLFIHSLVDLFWIISSFWLLMSKAAVNICVQVLYGHIVLFLLIFLKSRNLILLIFPHMYSSSKLWSHGVSSFEICFIFCSLFHGYLTFLWKATFYFVKPYFRSRGLKSNGANPFLAEWSSSQLGNAD